MDGKITNLKIQTDHEKNEKDKIDVLNTSAKEQMHKDYQMVVAISEETKSRAKEISYTKGLMAAKVNLAEARFYHGHYALAADEFLQALAYFEQADDLSQTSRIYNGLGKINGVLGNTSEAITSFEKSFEINESMGEMDGAITALNNIGIVFMQVDKYEAAIHQLDHALSLYRGHIDPQGCPHIYANLGVALVKISDYERASECLNKSVQLGKAQGKTFIWSTALSELGQCEFRSGGSMEKTLDYYEQSSRLATEHQLSDITINNMMELGEIYTEIGRSEEALGMFQSLYEISKDMDNVNALYRVSEKIYEYYKRIGDHERALAYLEVFVDYRGKFINEKSELKVQSVIIENQYQRLMEESELLRLKNEELSLKTEALERQKNRLMRLSNTDPLTGLYNRRYIYKLLRNLLEDIATSDRNGYLMMIDLDNFKTINDELGHSTGDQILIRLGTDFTSIVGRQGIVGRYGGDEFLIVLDDIEDDAIDRLVEDIHAMNQKIRACDKIPVCFSGGLIQLNKKDTLDEALCRVDHLLYESKDNGKCNIIYKSDEIL